MRGKPELLRGYNKPSDFKAVRTNVDEHPLFTTEGQVEELHNAESVPSSLDQSENGIPTIPAICQSSLHDVIHAQELHRLLTANYHWHALIAHRKKIEMLMHVETLRRIQRECSVFALANQAQGFLNNEKTCNKH